MLKKDNKWNYLAISLTLIFACLSHSVMMAQTRFESVVIDSKTSEPLAYASVSSSRHNATITNAEGAFRIKCGPTDRLQISFIGYKKVEIMAADLKAITPLDPIQNTLDEVVVKPLKLRDFIRKTAKETLQQIKLYGDCTSTFFYRQTSHCDTTCNEYVEAFLSGQAAVELKNLILLTGRYAAIAPDSANSYAYYRNYYTFSQLELVGKKREHDPDDTIVPLLYYYDNYYLTDYSYTLDDQGRSIVVINFTPRTKVIRPILAATLYIDEKTMHIRKVVGHGVNTFIRTGTWMEDEVVEAEVEEDAIADSHPYFTWIIPSDFDFVITMTEKNGYTEVESIHVETKHEFNDRTIATSSLLFNIGNGSKESGQDMIFYGNMHRMIEKQGYDPKFWKENEVVRRTPVEQHVAELFENDHLFGNYK